jgi:hypothetical protein
MAKEPLDQEEFSVTAEDLLFGEAEIDQNLRLDEVVGQKPEELEIFL